jgi:mono/diheme cytochrome c family protein
VLRVVVLLLLAMSTLMAADWRSGVTSSFREMPNPYETDRHAPSRGRRLYRDYCADCHAGRGTGTRSGPSLRSTRVAQARPGELFWLLRNGAARQGMPSFSFLNERDMWALVEFVRRLR